MVSFQVLDVLVPVKFIHLFIIVLKSSKKSIKIVFKNNPHNFSNFIMLKCTTENENNMSKKQNIF